MRVLSIVFFTAIAAGEHAFVFPGEARGPATATLCLARWDGNRPRPVAVHEPLSW